MQLHFSIDDVGPSLGYLAKAEPQDLFDTRFFGQLMAWHKRYNMRVTLYCYAYSDGFSFAQTPCKYYEAFRKNAAWLRFGFHARDRHTAVYLDDSIEAPLKLVREKIRAAGMGQTCALRLHHWRVKDDQIPTLRGHGVSTLLYMNDNALPYGNDGTYEHQGLIHRRTHVQFEHIDTLDNHALCLKNETVVAFTHEWCLDAQVQKINKAFERYSQAGYVFV